jgi:hypothetical protein
MRPNSKLSPRAKPQNIESVVDHPSGADVEGAVVDNPNVPGGLSKVAETQGKVSG